eukprot:s394_g1.t1
MFTVGGCRELVSHSNRASSAADTLSGAGRLPRLRQENPDASLWLRGVLGKVMRPASYEFGIQETGVFEQPVVSDPDLRYATDGSPGASQDPRFQALTWGVIAFRVDGSDLVICGKATDPTDLDVTLDCQGVQTNVNKAGPLWKAEDIFVGRLIEVDFLVQTRANEVRDLQWEAVMIKRDAVTCKVNRFLATRRAELLRYNDTEGPLIEFGTPKPPNPTESWCIQATQQEGDTVCLHKRQSKPKKPPGDRNTQQ